MVMWDTWEHTEHVRNARAGVDRASGFMSETACTPRRFEAWTLDLETETPGQPLIQTETPGWFRVQLSEYYNFGQIDPVDAALFWVEKMAF